MTVLTLPDLGEGLTQAKVLEWHVGENDEVSIDQRIVSVETAKSIVDIPAPCSGVIKKIHAHTQQALAVGEKLVEFISKKQNANSSTTVAGNLNDSDQILKEQVAGVDYPMTDEIKPRYQANLESIDTGLVGFRKVMAAKMRQHQQEVVQATIFDTLPCQTLSTADITATLIKGLCQALQQNPILNSQYYPGKELKSANNVELGLAVNTQHGLFLPIIHQAQIQSVSQLRDTIDKHKETIKSGEIVNASDSEPTFVLSNIGMYAGQHATPLVIPPAVAILAIGKRTQGSIPLSLSFNHLVITGGEAALFLRDFIQSTEALFEEAC